MSQSDLFWINEVMVDIPHHHRLYWFACFITGRRKKKFTYKDWYLILRRLYGNTDRKDNDRGKEIALESIVKIYRLNHNNNLPNGIELKNGER